MFLGYAFAIDYRDRRGHAYMLEDQEATKRLTKPQSEAVCTATLPSCRFIRELGAGDAMAGFEKTFKLSYQELSQKLHENRSCASGKLSRLSRPKLDGAARDSSLASSTSRGIIQIPTPTPVSGKITVNGAPIKGSHQYWLLVADDMHNGLTLASASVGGSYSALVFPGTYDVFFQTQEDGVDLTHTSKPPIKRASSSERPRLRST